MVKWTLPAKIDLREIREYIAKDSTFYAHKVSEEIVEASETLSTLPRRARIVPETDEDTVREIFLYTYRILYEIIDQDVYILAIIHGRRNISSADIPREVT